VTKRDKDFFDFLERPTSFRFSKIETILNRLGYSKVPAKGSHMKYKHPFVRRDIIVPVHNNECRPRYKKEIAIILKINFNP
jgi:predicted RNA binding protein YcfA (HicA-like mRNA interferase family)